MRKGIDLASGVALFLAGLAAGVLGSLPKPRSSEDDASAEKAGEPAGPSDGAPAAETAPGGPLGWTAALAELEARIAIREAASADSLDRIAARLDQHAAQLAEAVTVPQLEVRLATQESATSERFDSLAARLDGHAAKLADQETATAERFSQIAASLDTHAAKLAEVPTVSQIESRLTAREATLAEQLGQIVARQAEHAAKLAEVPTTPQIVSAMEQLLAKTMASLDERLATQAHSIDVLTTTVSQTDNLLERVLESLDTLQTSPESSENEDGYLEGDSAVSRALAPALAAGNVSIQKAGEMPQSVRSSVEYLLGRPIGPEEEVSIAAIPPQSAPEAHAQSFS